MNLITIILYEKLHRYVYDEVLNLKKKSNTKKEIYWYGVYKRNESRFKGWRIVLAIWLPFIKRYRRYAYYKVDLLNYELKQVNSLSRLTHNLTKQVKNIT